jgi:Ca2+/Na+ antiporter
MLQMIHVAVSYSANMLILLHSILSLFMSYINRKRDIKHGEECPAFITYCSIVLYGLISAI